jgi:hypothetical protein
LTMVHGLSSIVGFRWSMVDRRVSMASGLM